MHILPDAVEAVPDHVADQFPMGYFFAVLGFLILFLLTRVIAPIFSRGGHHGAGGCCATPVLPQVTVLQLICPLLTHANEMCMQQWLCWLMDDLINTALRVCLPFAVSLLHNALLCMCNRFLLHLA